MVPISTIRTPSGVTHAASQLAAKHTPGHPKKSRAAELRVPASLARDDAVRGQQIVAAVLDRLAPTTRIYVNRLPDNVIELLRDGGNITTIFSDPPKVRGAAKRDAATYVDLRRELEVAAGIHGKGSTKGMTVYGTLQFAPTLHSATSFSSRKRGPGRPTLGWKGAGSVSLVMRPEVVGRATFLPQDLFQAEDAPASRAELPAVVLKNIAMAHGAVRGARTEGVEPGARRAFEQAIAGSASALQQRVERYLTSRAMEDRYIEAQIPGATLNDVARIVVDAHPAVITREQVRTLRSLARRRGIPIDVFEPEARAR